MQDSSNWYWKTTIRSALCVQCPESCKSDPVIDGSQTLHSAGTNIDHATVLFTGHSESIDRTATMGIETYYTFRTMCSVPGKL